MTPRTTDWWRHAAIYQVYPRSFADGNGDGIGDLAGVRSRLDYLHRLGIEAIWFSPWYLTPMADAGYDVTDFRQIDPRFGTLAEAEKLIDEAHQHNIRIIVDVVPNHVSNEHAWFLAALAAAPGSPERDLFWFRDGRGESGELPPNEWQSIFGGPAWTRVPDGQWYLHLFAPEQPDLNWRNPLVRDEFEDVLRFWFDRGVDGIRVDSAAMCSKDPALPDYDHSVFPDPHPYVDLDENHDIYRGWRAVADSYPGRRALIGEVWLADPARFAQYLRADELHAAFNFDFLGCSWDAPALRACIDQTLAAHAEVEAPSTWVLSNHATSRATSPATGGPTPAPPRASASTTRSSTRTSAGAVPARPPCSPWRCPAPSTSTRARSSACPRSRTSPPTAVTTPSTTVRGARTPAGTVAACPCPGTGARSPTGSAPPAPIAPGCPSPPPGHSSTPPPRSPTPHRCSTSTERPWPCA
ncbi:alpha-amylase family glycosyl hydrolase [Streptomyces sp. S1A(2023)]